MTSSFAPSSPYSYSPEVSRSRRSLSAGHHGGSDSTGIGRINKAWDAMKNENYVLAIKLYKDGLRIMEAKEDSSPDIHTWATAAREELAVCEQLLSRPPRFFGPKVRQNARARIPLPIEVTGPMQIDFEPTCFGSPPVWRQKPWGVWKPKKMEHLFIILKTFIKF